MKFLIVLILLGCAPDVPKIPTGPEDLTLKNYQKEYCYKKFLYFGYAYGTAAHLAPVFNKFGMPQRCHDENH
jgi:hypothetical protein